MSATDSPLFELAAAVADGMIVDWISAIQQASNDADRRQIEELAAIAVLASLHTSGASQVIDFPVDPLRSLPCQWGPLLVEAPVGRGSSGVVYRAWDAGLDRPVALKMLHSVAFDPADVLHEGRLLARVRHPNVVTVFGAERIGGHVGLWMEFIEGRTLAQDVGDTGPVRPEQAMAIAMDLTGALAAVHAAGLVHRDVKAQNILRDAAGRIVLTDFGTGHEHGAQAAGDFAGTPLYLAPEVLAGGPATVASDIYSLGVVLFFLTTGTYPLTGRSLSDLRGAHARGDRRTLRELRPDLPRRLLRSVERAMAPDPAKRFLTADEFRSSLEGGSGMRRTLLAAAAIAVVLFVTTGVTTDILGGRWLQGKTSNARVPAGRYADAVTAPSPALRKLYDDAHAMFFRGREGMAHAERMLSDAVAESPGFASAHIMLAWAIRNQGRPESEVLPHADRAAQLASSLPATERLFITGSSHEMHGRHREAIVDYERLLRLDPEHYWALGNLAAVYSVVGERPLFLADLYERKARRYPNERAALGRATFELTKLGEVSRARPFLHAALKLPTEGTELGWLEFAEAYDAWLLAGPAGMRRVLDQLRGRLSVLKGDDRTRATHNLGRAYLDIGQIANATALFEELESVDPSSHQLIAIAASARGDLRAVRSALEAHVAAGRPRSYPAIGPLFFDAGLHELGFDLLDMWERERYWDPFFLRTFLGESLLAKGESATASSVLRKSIDENRTSRPQAIQHEGAPLLRASRTLARLEASAGRVFSAIRILEEATQDRVRACVFPQGDGYQWLHIRADLAELYGRVGRRQDAERVAEQVRNLLAFADDDHPLKRFIVPAANTTARD